MKKPREGKRFKFIRTYQYVYEVEAKDIESATEKVQEKWVGDFEHMKSTSYIPMSDEDYENFLLI